MDIRDTAGSSLLEVLLVLSLLSVLTATAVLGVRNFLLRPALKRQVRELMAVFDSCETKSLESHRKRSLEFDPVEGSVWEILSRDNDTSRSKKLVFESGVSIQSAEFGSGGESLPIAVYYGNGVASPGRVVLVDRFGRRCTIRQGLRGSRRLDCDE
jgi:hypothetical protein